jgi:hypothetical protein
MNEINFHHRDLGECSVKCTRDDVTDFIADSIFQNLTVSRLKIIPSSEEPLKVPVPPTVEYFPARPVEPENVAFMASNFPSSLRIAFGLLIAVASVWGSQWLFENTGYEFASVVTGIIFFISGLAIALNSLPPLPDPMKDIDRLIENANPAGNKAHENR